MRGQFSFSNVYTTGFAVLAGAGLIYFGFQNKEYLMIGIGILLICGGFYQDDRWRESLMRIKRKVK